MDTSSYCSNNESNFGDLFAQTADVINLGFTLTGEYPDIETTQAIKQGVVFWKTIQKLRQDDTVDQDLLDGFLQSRATVGYTHVVKLMELLPTRVFRRMLWFYNIDFQSFESCLRRLTGEQKQAIEETYEDLFVRRVLPRCMKEGLWNRVRQCTPYKRVTVDSLLSQPEDHPRYQTKGSIAYDFFAWGMGFNTYRMEKNDDPVPKQVTRQFLSPKNHENDFTVNKEEGGIYWFLYKMSRGNYLWGKPEEVTLSRAICPGFYLTLLIWLMLIPCSPLLLLAAACKFCFSKIIALLNKVLKQDIEIDEEYWLSLAFVVIAAFVGYILWNGILMIWDSIRDFSHGNASYATYFTAFLVVYVTYMGRYKKGVWPHEIPWIGTLTMYYISIQTFHDYPDTFFDVWFMCRDWFLENLSAIAYWSAVLTAFGSVYGLFIWFCVKLDKESNRYVINAEEQSYFYIDRYYHLFNILSIGIIVLTLGIFAYAINGFMLPSLRAVVLDWNWVGYISTYLLVCSLIAFYFSEGIDPDRLRVSRSIYAYEGLGLNAFEANPWIRSLKDPSLVTKRIWKFSLQWSGIDNRKYFIVSINAKTFERLSEYERYFEQKGKKLDFDTRVALCKLLLQDIPVSQAVAQLRQRAREKEVFKKKCDSFWNQCEQWITKWTDRTVAVWKYCTRWIEDFKEIKKGFDKRCPWVSVPKEIE